MNNNLLNTKDLNNVLFEGYEQSSDGIGILVELVKSGKIDPWNIDIVDVTEKYFQKMFEMKFESCKQNVAFCRNSLPYAIKCTRWTFY